MEAPVDWFLPKSPVGIGVVVVVGGLAGFLVFEGALSLLFAGVNGSGALLILGHSQTDATTTLGVAAVLGSWTILGVVETAWPLAVATGIGFGWFVLVAESEIVGEAYRRRTTNDDHE